MNLTLFSHVLDWLPQSARVQCVLRMPQRWVEEHFEQLRIPIRDIFYQRTWSLDFVERVLQPEHTELWDHVSVWYTLTDAWCDRNIDWLNFHDLVYSQSLSRDFYLRHRDRIDWLPATVDRDRVFHQLYGPGAPVIHDM